MIDEKVLHRLGVKAEDFEPKPDTKKQRIEELEEALMILTNIIIESEVKK